MHTDTAQRTASLTMDAHANAMWFEEPGKSIIADALSANGMGALEVAGDGTPPTLARACVEITEADGRCWLLDPDSGDARANPPPHNAVKAITVRLEHTDGTVITVPARWAANADRATLIDDVEIMIAEGESAIAEEALAQALHEAFVGRYVENAREASDWHEREHRMMARVEAARALSKTATEADTRAIEILSKRYLSSAVTAHGVSYTVRIGRGHYGRCEVVPDRAA